MPALWYRTISDGYRLRIGRELMDEVKWLSPTSTGKCTVTIGLHGQALFFPEDSSEQMRTKIEKSLAAEPITLSEVNEPWLDYARFIASQWSVSWGFELAGDRFVFYLTRELYHRNVLPEEKQTVAIFAAGGFFEVWKPELWTERTKALGREISSLTAEAEKRLDVR